MLITAPRHEETEEPVRQKGRHEIETFQETTAVLQLNKQSLFVDGKSKTQEPRC